MSFITKKQNRNKLIAVIAIAVIGGGLFMFYGEGMIDFASGIFTFDNDDGYAAQCSLDASLGAYDLNGDLIESKILQSQYFLNGIEVGYIEFTMTLTFSGTNVDWTTLDVTLTLTSAHSEVWSDVESLTAVSFTGDMTNTMDGGVVGDDYTYDYSFIVDDLDTFLTVVSTLEDGTDIMDLSLFLDVDATIVDLKGNTIQSGASITGDWTLRTLPDGTLDIYIDGSLPIDEVDPEADPRTDTNVVPKLDVEPKDSTMVD